MKIFVKIFIKKNKYSGKKFKRLNEIIDQVGPNIRFQTF